MSRVNSAALTTDGDRTSGSPGTDRGEILHLAHLSDPHLSSLDHVRLRDLANKRLLGYLSWRRHRRMEHRGEILDAALEDLLAMRPDHVVVTGDLTHLGLPAEFREVAQWLQTVGPPSAVTVVPGNHDSYVATKWEHTYAHWAPYLVSDAAQTCRDGAFGTFPTVRVRGFSALIGISTARPSAPFLAVGSVGKDQLHRVDQVLGEMRRQRRFRVVLIHHPPLAGAVRWRKRLTDSAALRDVLARQGAELVLHGHAHRASMTTLQTAAGTTLAVGVPSASAAGRKIGRGARYHIYRVKPRRDGWEVVIASRSYSPSNNAFVADPERGFFIPAAHP